MRPNPKRTVLDQQVTLALTLTHVTLALTLTHVTLALTLTLTLRLRTVLDQQAHDGHVALVARC